MMIISIVLMINLNIVKTKADNVNSLIYADEFTYIEEGNDIAILKYIGSNDKHLVIPEIINGKNVTVIKEDAFYGSQDVYTLRIPKTVNRIEGGAFSHCMNLNEIKVDKNNEYYLSEDGIVYTKGKTILVSCPSQKTNIIIPDTVTRIEKCSFSACKDLKIIEIPDSVTSIGDNAFNHCLAAREVEISDSVISIGSYAFFFSYLESIDIPSSVKYIGKGAIDCTIYGEKGSSAEEYSITDGNVKFKTFKDKEREKIIDKFVPYLLFTILLIIIFYFVWKNKLKKSDM